MRGEEVRKGLPIRVLHAIVWGDVQAIPMRSGHTFRSRRVHASTFACDCQLAA